MHPFGAEQKYKFMVAANRRLRSWSSANGPDQEIFLRINVEFVPPKPNEFERK